jgi:uncharacterized RDD family membrane protein YckC
MTDAAAPAGWYPDPAGTGGQRYFDGTTWTEHFVPPPPPMAAYGYPVGRPPWKGAQYGRPASGPGALANPGRRLGARALDALVLLPVLIAFCAITIALVAPHVGPIFPTINNNPNVREPVPGFVWIYLALFGCAIAAGVVMVFYEAIATVRYGRTLGKAWLHIRPVRTDGQPLGWGRSIGRVSLYFASGFLNWLGLLDPLWCLWDENQQCLHDKAAGTLVINDELSGQVQGEPGMLHGPAGSPSAEVWPVVQPATVAPAAVATNPYSYANPYSYGALSPAQPRNNGLAIASLVCSIVGIVFFAVPAVVGVIFGFVARSQIRQSNGTQTGDGMALAGIIVGIVTIGSWVLFLVVPVLSR